MPGFQSDEETWADCQEKPVDELVKDMKRMAATTTPSAEERIWCEEEIEVLRSHDQYITAQAIFYSTTGLCNFYMNDFMACHMSTDGFKGSQRTQE